MDKEVKAILETIKRTRKEKKISLQEMAGKLGLSLTGYRSIEEGITNLTVENMFKLFRILDIDFSRDTSNETLLYDKYSLDQFAKKDDLKELASKKDLDEALKIILKRIDEKEGGIEDYI